ncbi:MAG: tetraacyldisaccharide 4'-kinase [Hydrogenophaga sp.]|uniref:tetraacyldisaccharide 4'-kinase n=1 Tax=Hydrogenophaga sp. TaxID=1904254 RepID=UPI003D9B3D57
MSPARWQAVWSRRGPIAWLLWPASLLYGALGELRRALYRAGVLTMHRLPVPVVVVGNMVVGGAGKTPTVIALVRHLQAQGWHPGVVSRGYGRVGDGVLAVEDGTPASECGDEPALIHRSTRTPVFVAPRRVDAALALLAQHPEVNLLLCDDGLQHLALGRDLSIAVFDERGSGNGWQLPAGLLREPWPSAPGDRFAPDLLLRQRRDEVTGAPLAVPPGMPAFEARRRLADHAVNRHGQRVALAELAQQPLTAVAGIARPEVFFDMLRERGLPLQRAIPMADHARAQDYAALELASEVTVVCTEKDAVKLFEQLPPGAAAWAVPLDMTPEPAFWTTFDTLLAQRVARR